jgi:hypothetical protein
VSHDGELALQLQDKFIIEVVELFRSSDFGFIGEPEESYLEFEKNIRDFYF